MNDCCTTTQTKLGELSRELTTGNTTVRTVVGHGDAASEIVRIAEHEHADLIVIATHGMTGWRRVLFGSVAERVVRLASYHCMPSSRRTTEPTPSPPPLLQADGRPRPRLAEPNHRQRCDRPERPRHDVHLSHPRRLRILASGKEKDYALAQGPRQPTTDQREGT
jgi:hypothetical protein